MKAQSVDMVNLENSKGVFRMTTTEVDRIRFSSGHTSECVIDIVYHMQSHGPVVGFVSARA